MNPLDDPITPEERQVQHRLVRQALQKVIGGPQSLRFPPARVVEALCDLAGFFSAVTIRDLDDIMPLVEEGRGAVLGEGLPPPAPFQREAPRQVKGLAKQLLLAMATTQQQRIGTAEALTMLAFLVGQVSQLVVISAEDLRTLLQAGFDQGKPYIGNVQAGFARYYVDKARRGLRS